MKWRVIVIILLITFYLLFSGKEMRGKMEKRRVKCNPGCMKIERKKRIKDYGRDSSEI